MSMIASEFSRQPSERRIAIDPRRHRPTAPEQMPFAEAAWPIWRPIRRASSS